MAWGPYGRTHGAPTESTGGSHIETMYESTHQGHTHNNLTPWEQHGSTCWEQMLGARDERMQWECKLRTVMRAHRGCTWQYIFKAQDREQRAERERERERGRGKEHTVRTLLRDHT